MDNQQAITEFRRQVSSLMPIRRITRDVFLEVGHIFLSEMQENFRVGGRPTPWPASSRVRQFGGQTLVRSAALTRSLSVAANRDSATIGSNKVYARIHALGGVIRAKNAKYLSFRVPAGIRYTDRRGKEYKTPRKFYAWVRVKEVRIPQRDYTYISESGFERALTVIERHMKTVN